MKILLDECIDRRITKTLEGYEVTTVPKRGWAGIKNGALLKLMVKEFDVFITGASGFVGGFFIRREPG